MNELIIIININIIAGGGWWFSKYQVLSQDLGYLAVFPQNTCSSHVELPFEARIMSFTPEAHKCFLMLFATAPKQRLFF